AGGAGGGGILGPPRPGPRARALTRLAAFLAAAAGRERTPAKRLEPAPAVIENAQLADPQAIEQLERSLVVGAHVLGPMSVAGKRHVRPGPQAHLEKLRCRVELPDRLAQPGARDLDRDTRPRYPLHGQLV